MLELFQYEFFRNAILAAILASVACGIIGPYVIVKRITFMSGSIAHCAFGGLGLGVFLGINPFNMVLPFCILSAMSMGLIVRYTKINADTIIGIFWAVCMAFGIALINLSPGYVPDLMSYLFGNILAVPLSDIKLMGILDCIIVITVFIFFKEFLAFIFDEEYAESMGIPVTALYLLLLVLVSLTTVVLIRIVGIVLVIALLTIPSAIAKQYTNSLRQMMLIATCAGIFFTLGGLLVSYMLNITSGATIILFAGISFSCVMVERAFFRYRAKQQSLSELAG